MPGDSNPSLLTTAWERPSLSPKASSWWSCNVPSCHFLTLELYSPAPKSLPALKAQLKFPHEFLLCPHFILAQVSWEHLGCQVLYQVLKAIKWWLTGTRLSKNLQSSAGVNEAHTSGGKHRRLPASGSSFPLSLESPRDPFRRSLIPPPSRCLTVSPQNELACYLLNHATSYDGRIF